MTDRSTVLPRRAVVAGILAGVVAPAWANAPARIEIAGSQLLRNGQILRLRGLAMGDPVYIRAGRLLTDYADIASGWSANCVRISVHPGHWRHDPVRTAASLDADIRAARSLGLFVIIDWHAIGFSRLHEPVPPPQWGLPPDAYLSSIEDAAGFWRAMAHAYSADPAVLFELWNEPVGDARHWVSDGAYWPLFKAGWQQVTAEIRAVSDNIILASGGRWAHDLSGAAADLMPDPRTAYAWHVYPNEDRGDPDRWFKSLAGIAAQRPVVVTEWGFCPACDGGLQGGIEDFAIPFTTDVLDALGLGHTAWCYSPGASPALLNGDDTPSAYGAFVKGYLHRSAALEPLVFAPGELS
jgi:hypothetical protein